MAKKQLSFAEKAARHKSSKDWKTIKYIKSERSAKTGSWRFNENFIQLATNENLDQALARMEAEVKDLAQEMVSIEEKSSVPESKSAEKSVEDKVVKEVIAEETVVEPEISEEKSTQSTK